MLRTCLSRPLRSRNGVVVMTTRCFTATPTTFSAVPSPERLPPNISFDANSSLLRRIKISPPVITEDVEETTDANLVNNEPQEQQDDDDDEIYYDDDEDELEELIPLSDRLIYATPLPERLNVPIHTLFPVELDNDNENTITAHHHQVGSIWLDETVFGCDPVRVDLLKRAVDYIRAKKRGRRKAVTKTIGQVSGSGKKRRQQKGSGRARMGHSRPPHHRGGAKAHGPKNVTDYGNTKLNAKVRQAALRHVLSQKLLENNLIILNHLYELPSHKTKDLAHLLEPLNLGGKGQTRALILDHYHPTDDDDEQPQATSYRGVPLNFWLASSNIWNVTTGNDHNLNVYDALKHEKLVLTLSAVEQLQKRLSLA